MKLQDLSFCPDPDPDLRRDPDSVSMSRKGIEDKLVEEYRSSQHYRQTKAELGQFRTRTWSLSQRVTEAFLLVCFLNSPSS